MDEFSYLWVLISVILGLAVTQVLKGFRGILLSRTRIRIYWPVIAWAALLLLICVQSWWAMFPGYLFAKFSYPTQRRAVESSHGIRGIVRFGDRLATLPEEIVIALHSRAGAEEVVTIDSSLKIGQPVHIIEGPFQGLEVVVTQLLPARERIRVLLEFLGRSLEMEVPAGKVLPA